MSLIGLTTFLTTFLTTDLLIILLPAEVVLYSQSKYHFLITISLHLDIPTAFASLSTKVTRATSFSPHVLFQHGILILPVWLQPQIQYPSKKHYLNIIFQIP